MIVIFITIPTACDNATSSTSYDTTAQTSVTTQPPATEPDYPVSGRLVILPITDKEMEVHFSINIERIWEGTWPLVGAASDTLADSRAWITVLWAGIDGSYSEARQYTEIPFEDIVVSGDISWEGNAQETRTIELQSTIRLPEDGKWDFVGKFAGDNWIRPVRQTQRMAVAGGIVVPNYPQDLLDSPLAYLELYGHGLTGKLPADEKDPVYLELDMTHPPLAGEEVTITYLALSPYYDINDFKVETYFKKRNEENKVVYVPAAEIVVNTEIGWDVDAWGNTIWKDWETDIAKGEMIELTHVIKFPEPGEWEIRIYSRCILPEVESYKTSDNIKLTITEGKAYYGWQDRRSSKTQEQITSRSTESAIDQTSNTLWWWIGGGVGVAGILAVVLLR